MRMMMTDQTNLSALAHRLEAKGEALDKIHQDLSFRPTEEKKLSLLAAPDHRHNPLSSNNKIPPIQSLLQ